jgi:hypothetical protein
VHTLNFEDFRSGVDEDLTLCHLCFGSKESNVSYSREKSWFAQVVCSPATLANETVGGGEYNYSQKSISLSDLLSMGHRVIGIPLITQPKTNLCTTLRAQNNKNKNCIVWHAQNTTAFQPHVFLTGICRLLLTKDGRLSPAQNTAKFNCKFHSHYLSCPHFHASDVRFLERLASED